jgi:hypothetical protein
MCSAANVPTSYPPPPTPHKTRARAHKIHTLLDGVGSTVIYYSMHIK